MSEWGIALIAAGSAVAGSLVTGWFSRGASIRQAEAARHAGDRQADAALDTVRRTLAEQRAVRVLDQRRESYVRFLAAADTATRAWRSGDGLSREERSALQRAHGAVLLEGPAEVAHVAERWVEHLGRVAVPPADIDRCRREFVAAAQEALRTPDPPTGDDTSG